MNGDGHSGMFRGFAGSVAAHVEAVICLDLAHLAERGHPLQITNDTSQVIQIMAPALRAHFESILADITAVVADSIAAIEREVIRAIVGSDPQQLTILIFRKMLSNVHVQGRTAVKMLYIFIAVKLELIYHRQGIILWVVEVGTVHVVLRRHIEAVSPVPVVVLAREILARDEFCIEHGLRRLVLSVGNVYRLQDSVHELVVFRIRAYGETQELCCVRKAVDPYRQILPSHIYESGLVNIQHLCS